MDASQYRDAIQRLGFGSINEAGRWLGLSEAAGRRFAKDGPPPNVAKLLELMQAEHHSPASADEAIQNWKTGGAR